MIKKSGILTVSLIAMVAALPARADIASTTYVNDKIQPVETKIDNHIANKLAIDTDQGFNLTGTQKGSKTLYPSMSTVTAMLDKSSEDLTSAIGLKVDVEQGNGQGNKPDNRNKAMITNAGGQVVPGQIATAMIADKAVTNDKLSDAVNTSLGLADSAVQPAAISDMETKTHASGTYATQTALGTTNSNVSNLTTRVGTAEGNITSLQSGKLDKKATPITASTANSIVQYDENGLVVSGTPAGSMATENKNNYYTKTEIGTPTAGKTIVQMISDAQTAATYDDTALAGRVTANEDAIETLNGDATVTGSVAKKIADAVASYELLSNVTSKGDTDTPVYFDANGVATPITAYDGTAARATADASGNNIVNTYETKAHVGTIPNGSSATTVIGYVDEKVGAVNTAVGNLGTMANESKDDYYTKTAANSQFVEAGAGVTETTTANYLVKYDEQGLVTGGVAAGALAKKDTVAKTDLASALKTEIEGKANSADLGTAASANVSENGVAANESGLVTGGQVQTAISNLNLGTTYQTKSDSTAVKGNYIAAGTGVGANLGALDTKLKAVENTANDAVKSVTKSGSGNILTDITTSNGAVTVSVSGTAIPKPSGNCTDCVLHFNGTEYSWEEVGR